MKNNVKFKTTYEFECYTHRFKFFGFKIGKKLRWKETVDNIVVTAGLNKILDATFKTGLATPAWYVGLKNTGTPDAADTMGSHGTWTENTTYSNTERPDFTPGSISAGSVDNDAAKAQFNINGTTEIFGGFLADDDTKGGTTGILYGVADFASSREVEDGDILNVKVTLTAATA